MQDARAGKDLSRTGVRALVLLAMLGGLAACGLPRSGPNKSEIYSSSVQQQGDAFIVPVTAEVARLTAQVPSSGFSADFAAAGLIGSDVIAAGDMLALTIYENVKDDPLLGNTGQRVSALSEIQVDGDGYIFIPYAGRILAAGQTPEELRQTVTGKLEEQTPDPQVLISRAAGDGSTVTVSGAIAQGVYPIERPSRTLSGMIASAGGVTVNPEAAIIRVTRGGATGQVWLQDLYANPRLDIALRPGDQIVVEEDNRKFVALGATGAQRLISFETQTVSAIEALAIVGGLNSALADPTGVFVMRTERAHIANAVLGRSDLTGEHRIIYVLDLTQATGIFDARDFLVRDGDTVYVTEAPYVQWTKTLSAITGTAGAASGLATATGL